MFSRRKPSRTCLADIEQYFHQPPPQFLDLELAVCWILECLLKDDNYPSGLLQKLIREEPQLRLSETVLQKALDFLEQQGSISSYTQRCPSPFFMNANYFFVGQILLQKMLLAYKLVHRELCIDVVVRHT